MAAMNQTGPETALVSIAHRAVQQAIATLPTRPSPPNLAIQSAGGQEMNEKQRDAMRSLGKQLLGLTIQYASGAADETIVEKGRELGQVYGNFTSHKGMSVGQTVATFNFFRATIIEATFDMPDLETSSFQLYQRLEYFFNEVLLAMVQAVENRLPKLSE